MPDHIIAPSEWHIHEVAKHIRKGKTVLSACFMAGILFPKALRWLEAGRQGTCPACRRFLRAIQEAGKQFDDEHLKKITVRPEE